VNDRDGGEQPEAVIDRLVLNLMEIFESAGVVLPLSQARAIAGELVTRFPEIAGPAPGPAPPPRKPWTRWTKQEYELLRQLHQGGMSKKDMAHRLNRTPGQVNGAITRLGLTTQDRRRSKP
jgi:DNA-binding CsgD family transcriptional regulator